VSELVEHDEHAEGDCESDDLVEGGDHQVTGIGCQVSEDRTGCGGG
jgi:hypothetical protein